MALPLDATLKIGIITMLRRSEPAGEPWLPERDAIITVIEQVDKLGFDSFWCGDHIAFTIPFLDPLLQIAQAAVVSRRLTFGTAVYLLPLRHPTPVAKQVATLDHLTGGRFIFGVGIGGEFPKEYESCGVPINERGARLGEGIEVIRKLWSGESVSHHGRFFRFEDVRMTPPPRQKGGPPIWCGGRSEAALRRAARIADGWFSYAVSPEMFAKGLSTIAAAAREAGRTLDSFGTAHLLFTRIGDNYERALDEAASSLSTRYGMNMRPAAQRYAAIGTPRQVAEKIRQFHAAGVRHLSLDFVGPYERRGEQLERFAAEVRPLVSDLMAHGTK
jgi:probable F420-dependent oxidoreductase